MKRFLKGSYAVPVTRRSAMVALTMALCPPLSSASAAASLAGDDDCPLGYDPVFEDDLVQAVEALPAVAADRGQRHGPVPRGAKPLRRRYWVSTRYRVRGDWLAGYHTGIDLAVPTGTPVHAVGAGVVVLAKWSGSYGKAVTVRMTDGHFAVYGHLSTIDVRQGARVGVGQRLGRSGSTGRASGPHLHLEIRARRQYGSDVNPISYLARRGVRLVA
ncbi:M23 family metallopeptidase [Streptomyces sp. NPDC004111]|uniref:M23 family metallopeptidase n=1 Tax=Streptomyces sp. NPDC004111 TaxID=3364690 RepID=UPI0036812FC3